MSRNPSIMFCSFSRIMVRQDLYRLRRSRRIGFAVSEISPVGRIMASICAVRLESFSMPPVISQRCSPVFPILRLILADSLSTWATATISCPSRSAPSTIPSSSLMSGMAPSENDSGEETRFIISSSIDQRFFASSQVSKGQRSSRAPNPTSETIKDRINSLSAENSNRSSPMNVKIRANAHPE